MEPKDHDDLAANAAEEELKDGDAATSDAAEEKPMNDDAATAVDETNVTNEENDNGDDILLLDEAQSEEKDKGLQVEICKISSELKTDGHGENVENFFTALTGQPRIKGKKKASQKWGKS